MKENKTSDINEYMRKYMKEYYKEHKEMWEKREKCETCQKEYKISHKTEHNNTKKHKYLIEKHRKSA